VVVFLTVACNIPSAPDDSVTQARHTSAGSDRSLSPASELTATTHAVKPLAANAFQYCGGRVIPHPQVVGVVWAGASEVFEENIWTMEGFLSHYLKSPYTEWLSEYSTSTTTLGEPGQFIGMYEIIPTFEGAGRFDISDDDISSELATQIHDNSLPAPGDDTIYVVYMPQNITITDNVGFTIQDPSTGTSCQGYHNSSNGITYAVVAASSVCDTPNNTIGGAIPGGVLSRITSHELIETITDPDGGSFWSSDWGWVSNGCSTLAGHGDEIADYCEFTGTPDGKFEVPELNGLGYDVETGFSDLDSECITHRNNNISDMIESNGSFEAEWQIPGGHYSAGIGGPYPANWVIQGAGDVNRDGTSDFIWRYMSEDGNNPAGEVGIWFIANGQYVTSVLSGSAPLDYNLAAVADINGDGTADFIWFEPSTSDVWAWVMDPSGAISVNEHLGAMPVGWQFGGAGDFNHDGTSDLFFYLSGDDGRQHLGVWLMSPYGLVTNELYYPSSPIPTWHGSGEPVLYSSQYSFAAVGDFNGDVTSDVAWLSNTNTLRILEFTTNCQAGVDICVLVQDVQEDLKGTEATAGGGYVVAATGDFDGNGYSDFLFRNPSTGDIWTWLTTYVVGSGGVATLIAFPASDGIVGVETGTQPGYEINATGYFGFHPD